MDTPPFIHWIESGEARSALWRSETGAAPAARVVVADDAMTADEAYGLACQGTALLWRGDFQNARQMLQALGNRADRQARKGKRPRAFAGARIAGASEVATTADTLRGSAEAPSASAEAFNLHRQARSQRARTLGSLLIPLDSDYKIPLRRAPDVRVACAEAFGPAAEASVISLQAVLGAIGAHEWRLKGIEIPAAGGRIHPHYGVFAPIRREYVQLVASAPLPAALTSTSVAFDIGTGTGVLAAVLARRGVRRVVATDRDPRALACARENVERLGLAEQVEVVEADLFPPEGHAALVVCNPPWIPARPSSPIEGGIYDFESRMLRGFLTALPAHLEPEGEGWLILSDLAEHLGLRSRDELLAAFESADLKVIDRIDVRPEHPKASDTTDPLHAARAAEVTSLWRLTVGANIQRTSAIRSRSGSQ